MPSKVKRPADWDRMSQGQRTKWLKDNLTIKVTRKGKYTHLKDKDKEKIWMLMEQLGNKALVAQTLGCGRKTLYRFLEKHPVPETFTLQDDVMDFEEIKVWLGRQKAFSKANTIGNYKRSIRKFYAWMQEHYPARARPRLWASDQILEWVQTHAPNIQHQCQSAIRQLAKKCPNLFPLIDLGLLPTRKTAKARKSLAGHEEYYLDLSEVRALLKAVDEIDDFDFTYTKRDGTVKNMNVTYDDLHKKAYKAMIAILFNIGCRTGNTKTGLGMVSIRLENLKVDAHIVTIKDKFDITWRCLGLADDTCKLLKEYLDARGNPTHGWLFVNGNGNPFNSGSVNMMLKVVGQKAGITDKMLVCKTFRKSLVKHCLEVLKMNPVSLIGTGKDPKTCFCVGWTSLKVMFAHYAPELKEQIETDRMKFRL